MIRSRKLWNRIVWCTLGKQSVSSFVLCSLILNRQSSLSLLSSIPCFVVPRLNESLLRD